MNVGGTGGVAKDNGGVRSDRTPRRSIWKFPREKFPALTGIRAIAAYLVFFHHYTPSEGLVSTPVHDFLSEGHVGVTLFYVLSGFLITYNYWDKAQGNSGAFWFQYLGRRFARIYPVYLFLLALTFLLPVVLRHEAAAPWLLVFLNATLLKGFFEAFEFSGIDQSWSLTVEETFYLLAPIIFILIRRYGYAAVQVLLYGCAGLLLYIGTNIAYYGFFGSLHFVALFTFFGRSFEFIAGIILARMVLTYPKLLASRRGHMALTLTGILSFVFIVFWMSLLRRNGAYGLYHPLGMVLNNLLLPVFVCILYLGLIGEQTIPGRILASRGFVFLGRASYSFYLVHNGVFAKMFQRQWPISSEPLRLLAMFVAMNVVASVVFLAVEHPANHWIRMAVDGVVPWRKALLEPEDPGRMLKRYVFAAATGLGILFLGWCTVSFDWLSQAAAVPPSPRMTLRGGPNLGRLLSARTDYGLVMTRLDQLGILTGKAGGKPVTSDAFIYAHANSKLEYDISSMRASTFEFSTGLDDFGGADTGKVKYVVRGDGKILFESPVVHALDQPARYNVAVGGVRRLELIVNAVGDGIVSDEAYWIHPVLR